MDGNDMGRGKCPVMHGSLTTTETSVTAWWPQTLNFDILHQHDSKVLDEGHGQSSSKPIIQCELTPEEELDLLLDEDVFRPLLREALLLTPWPRRVLPSSSPGNLVATTWSQLGTGYNATNLCG